MKAGSHAILELPLTLSFGASETSLAGLGTLELLFALLGFMYRMEEKLLSQK